MRLPETSALIVFLLAESLFFTLKSPYFLGWDNWINIVTAIAVIGIVAAPGTLLLTAGQFDLSVGSVTGFTAVVFASVSLSHDLVFSLVVAVLAALAVGVANGIVVTYIGVNALIATLGALAVVRGLSLVVSKGETISIDGFATLGTARPFWNIPVVVLIFVFVLGLFWVLMRYTVFGRSMYAIGSNPSAARLSGIRSRLFVFIAFVLSAGCCGLAGLLLASQLGVGSPTFGAGMELSVITAIVLGGASLGGGKGSVVGTAVGLLIIGVLNNGLTLTGVDPFWQDVARGSLLVGAVSFDRLRARLGDRAKTRRIEQVPRAAPAEHDSVEEGGRGSTSIE